MQKVNPVRIVCQTCHQSALSVPRAEIDRIPQSWTCPACEDRQREAWAIHHATTRHDHTDLYKGH